MSSAYQIVARSGPTAGSNYPLDKNEIFLGRDLNNDIVINDPEVSRRHARLYLQGSAYVIEDLGSTNGTMINGQKITGPHQLISGEVLTLGENIVLVYEAPEAGHADVTMVAGMDGEDATVRAGSDGPAPYTPDPYAADPYASQRGGEQATMPDPYAGQPVSPMDQATTPDPYAADPYSAQPQGGYADPYGGQMQGGYQDPYGAQPGGGYAGQLPDQPSEPVEGRRKLPVILVVAIIVLLVVCICGVGGFIIDTLELYCPLGGPVINMVWPGACP